MESSPRLIPQIYGYAVCLVSVVTILIAASQLIDGIFDAAMPAMSRNVDAMLGGSFEAYRDRRVVIPPVRVGSDVQPEIAAPPEDVLRRMYEEERRTHIASARYQGIRRLVGSLLMLVIAGALFVTHWRWLRRTVHATAT